MMFGLASTGSGFLDTPIGETPYVLRQMLWAAALPLVIGIVFALPWSKRKPTDGDEAEQESPKRPARDWFAARLPIALAGALALAFLMLEGKPDEQWHSLLWAGLAGAGFGVVLSITPSDPSETAHRDTAFLGPLIRKRKRIAARQRSSTAA